MLQGILGGFVNPVEVLEGHDQRPKLRALENDPFQGLDDSILPCLGGHQELLLPALVERKELQEMGKIGLFVDAESPQPCFYLFPNLRFGASFLDVEAGLQDIDDGVIHNFPAVGEASALKKGDILVGDGLAELVEEP